MDDDELDEILNMVADAPVSSSLFVCVVLAINVWQVKELDAMQLKQLLLRFEKAISENVKMRTKHPDKPDKFMESEVELDEAISAMRP